MVSQILHPVEFFVNHHFYYLVSIIPFILALVYLRKAQDASDSDLPWLNPKHRFEPTFIRPKANFRRNARKLLEGWFEDNADSPVNVVTDFGIMIVLPTKMASEIRNDSRLDFRKINEQRQWLMIYIPDWHAIPLRETILHVVARVSSRIFLGLEVCRNENWLRITREYTVTSIMAAEFLRLVPVPLRPLANMLFPLSIKCRGLIFEARSIIEPLVLERRRLKSEAKLQGKELTFDDAIDWSETAAQLRRWSLDQTKAQLVLSLATIHSTTDLVTQFLIDLAPRPEMIQILRQEIISVLRQQPLTKLALSSMKLLDSAIKETQRMKPLTMISMLRVALEDVVLSDGTCISKGRYVGVTARNMWNKDIYPDPGEWIGSRFKTIGKDPAQQHLAQLVATNANFTAFGHGKHACPGRFFASEQIKIMLVHMLLNYDIRLFGSATPTVWEIGMQLIADPKAKMEIRVREPGIELGANL
ncbi:hypothetical protein MY10362_009735 [Beauveria mimosiformis]